ncbi:helix-turn-helix domain-containing protein [Anaerocolumna sedimenticola]|uniref:Helix-turn-helix domain-containing protein n=1 Tax=Anaerocolumna sedimenticola TaxID=2696063 RepID=A0A6P1TJ66_9FIRM|nr:AraC family transcriptional regulator [Anaerocolumna sedimenticola]QHQ60159.1 helix-turn-helix domain-containing protein [Anaerocolumna sedimenticola]
MRKIINKLLSYSVYRKTLLAYSVSILIITVLILICTYKVFTNNLKNYSTETSKQLLNQLVSGVENLKTDVDNVMTVIAGDSKALRFYQNKNDNKQDDYYLFLRLTDIKSYYSYIEDIAAINFNNSVCVQALGSNNENGDIDFASSMINKQKYIVPRTIKISKESKNVVSFLQYLPYYNAAIVIDVNADLFQYSINKNGREERNVYIIDSNGNAVTGNTKDIIQNNPLSDYFYSIITLKNKTEGCFVYDDKAKRQMVFFSKSAEFSWWFIDVQDYSYFNKAFQDISYPFIGISAFFILICILISALFNKKIKKPLVQLVNKIRNAADAEELSDMDELRYLDIAIARGKQERYAHQNYIRTQFLRCLLLGQQMPVMIPDHELRQIRGEYSANHFCVLLIKIQNLLPLNEAEQEEEFKIYRYTICNLADEIFEKSFHCKSVDIGNDLVGLLFMLDKKDISEDYMLSFKQLKQFAEEMIRITVSGSLGLIVDSQKDVSISCQKAKQYLEMNQLIGREELIDSNNQVTANYHEKNKKLVESILEYTNSNYKNPDLSLKSVSQVFGLSTTYVGKIFKSIQGESYSNYVMNYRLEKTKVALLETTKTINDIAIEFGFTNSAYYATLFKNAYGMTPTVFRNSAGIRMNL